MELLKNTSSVMTSGSVKQPTTESFCLKNFVAYSAVTGSPYFSTVLENSLNKLGSFINNSIIGVKYTALAKSKVVASLAMLTASNYPEPRIEQYTSLGVRKKASGTMGPSGAGDSGTATNSFDMDIGDYLLFFYNGSSVPNTTTGNDYNNVSVIATSIDSIQPNFVVNITPPTAEKNYFLEAAGNAGQAITANVTDIPFILTSQQNLSWLGDKFIAPIDGVYDISGMINFTTALGLDVFAYINGIQTKAVWMSVTATNYFYFSSKVFLYAGQSFSLRTNIGGTLLNNTFRHNISITRLNGLIQQTLIGNVPRELVAILNYSGTRTAFSSTPSPMPISSISGENSFITTNANGQFTLQSGEYDIDWRAMLYFATGSSATTRLYNVTDGVYLKDAIVSSGTGVYLPSLGAYRLSLSSAKTFEIRAVSVGGTLYIGDNQSSPLNCFGDTKIRKLA